MKGYFVKTPSFIPLLFKNYVWSYPKKEKHIYLTFDDGPTSNITAWTLNELAKYNAKATFFCVGENIIKHPKLTERIIREGHRIGNHTHNHLNALKQPLKDYLKNVYKANEILQPYLEKHKTKLFRPPFGKIKKAIGKFLIEDNYKIIMWSVLSGDFDTSISNEKCLQNTLKNAKNGSIIVFHDSEKCEDKLKFVLPKFLDIYSKKGFRFKAVSTDIDLPK